MTTHLARSQPKSLARQGQRAILRRTKAKALGTPGRKTSLKTMLGLGSQLLDRLRMADDHYQEAAKETWQRMQVAWNSGRRGDQRTALTGLQSDLARWTAEDANVAEDGAVQNYRKKLHLVLDH